MGKTKDFIVYHGTDYTVAEKIISDKFSYNTSDEHWLGNGIYFYEDFSLAKWWTSKPSTKFGSKIVKPAIISCSLMLEDDKILDLRSLDNYIEFSAIYNDEFIPQVFKGYIKVEREPSSGKFHTKKLRCTFCDYLKDQFELQAIIGTFDLPSQPYLPPHYEEGFKSFSLNYIETQVCVFDPNVIRNKQIIGI